MIFKWDLQTEQASLINWKNPLHTATNVNGSALTYKYGLHTTYLVNYLNLNFIPSTDCTLSSIDDTAFSIDDLTMEETLYYNFGSRDTTNTFSTAFRTLEIGALRPWAFVNAGTWKVWNGAAGAYLYYVQRNNSSTIQIYKAVNTSTSGTSASQGMPDQSLVLGGYRTSNGIVTPYNISTSTFYYGKCFTPEQRASWYEIIDYWKANISSV
jgi:hypothetical protein